MIEHILKLLKELAICAIVMAIIVGIAACSGILCVLLWLATSALRGQSFAAFLKAKSENRLIDAMTMIFQLTYPFLLSPFSERYERRSDEIADSFFSALGCGG